MGFFVRSDRQLPKLSAENLSKITFKGYREGYFSFSDKDTIEKILEKLSADKFDLDFFKELGLDLPNSGNYYVVNGEFNDNIFIYRFGNIEFNEDSGWGVYF